MLSRSQVCWTWLSGSWMLRLLRPDIQIAFGCDRYHGNAKEPCAPVGFFIEVIAPGQDQNGILSPTARLIEFIEQGIPHSACDHDQGRAPGKLVALLLDQRN